jgi:hypothetical protein
MRAWVLVLLLLLATASPAPARTLKELFVDAQRSRLAALQSQVRTISARNPLRPTDTMRLRELRKEIRQVEDGLKALNRGDALTREP